MSRLESMGRRTVRRIRDRRDSRLRRPPRLRKAPTGSNGSSPRVYYLCPDTNAPTGGIRTIYRHVDALNSVGIPAAVVHTHGGFVCSWFDHDTLVTSARSVRLTVEDVLVVPEFVDHHLLQLPPDFKIVIFNQNTYRTFHGRRSVGRDRHWNLDNVAAMLVVSHDNYDYASYAFRDLRVERIRSAIDGKTFYPARQMPGRRIAVMPRRRAADCNQVLNLLALRGCLDSWQVVIIDGKSEAETAELLRSCSLFLSFSEQEGFGLPPAEAMACGCYVVGYTGLAGREFFDDRTCAPVADGDVVAFARAVERTIESFNKDPARMRLLALEASARVLGEYNVQAQRAEVVAFFGSLLSCSYARARSTSESAAP